MSLPFSPFPKTPKAPRARESNPPLTSSSSALGYFVPPAFVQIQWRTYIIFGVFCIAMFVHVFFLFPETAGKKLEEVEELFASENGIKYIGVPAWKTRVGHVSTRRESVAAKLHHYEEGSPERKEGVLAGDRTPERKEQV